MTQRLQHTIDFPGGVGFQPAIAHPTPAGQAGWRDRRALPVCKELGPLARAGVNYSYVGSLEDQN
jgi:hypothetical protein